MPQPEARAGHRSQLSRSCRTASRATGTGLASFLQGWADAARDDEWEADGVWPFGRERTQGRAEHDRQGGAEEGHSGSHPATQPAPRHELESEGELSRPDWREDEPGLGKRSATSSSESDTD